jgi:hypothetical protein
MKANEAPEKIYIQSFNVSEEEAKFTSKLFFDDVWTEEPESGKENIEYVRKDTLIEKALEWIRENIRPYYHEVRYKYEDFEKYMKGE